MKTFLKILAVILLIILGIGALYGGWMLISDPSGNKFEWTVELLAGAPFENFLVPGIILALLNGLLPLVITVLILIKAKNHEWLIIIQGCILLYEGVLIDPIFLLSTLGYYQDMCLMIPNSMHLFHGHAQDM